MSEYSEDKKLLAVQAYFSGGTGLKAVARSHAVDVSALRSWIAAYRQHGKSGLQKKKRVWYSAEFKLSVLLRMDSEGLSCRQVAALFDIRRFDLVGIWRRRYDEGGLNALTPKSKQRHNRMPKSEVPQGPQRAQRAVETLTKQELIDEIVDLRTENAYLKKLDALIQTNKKSAPLTKR